MTLHHILKDVPDNWLAAVNNLLGALHCLHDTALNELTDNEWLVELGCHKLWQTYLTHVELRTNNDYREIYPEQTKLKKQFDYADKKAIPFLSIVGGNEVAEGVVNIKNLSTGEQKSFAKTDIDSILTFLQ